MHNEIRKLFGSGELPVVLSDSPYVLDRFRANGFATLSVDFVCENPDESPDDVMLVPAMPSEHPNEKLRQALANSSVLLIPLLAFSSTHGAIDYLSHRLTKLNFSMACERNRIMVEYVQHADAPILVQSNGCKLEIELGANVDVFAPKLKPSISRGEWISIIQFLEVAMVPNEDNSSFNVNGSLVCDGVSIAHHMHTHSLSGPIADEIWQRMLGFRKSNKFPLKLKVKDSRMVSILTPDGDDILNLVKSYTDDMMHGYLTEVGFGALQPTQDTNWLINSQLNEPSGGVHLALGAGEEAAHIDFISPNAIVQGIH